MKKLTSMSFALILTVGAFSSACVSQDDPNRRTKKGAAVGAVAGAAAGAVIGHQSGERDKGAAVGAVVGAGVGAAIGAYMDKQQRELEQIDGVQVTRTAEDELNVVMENDILFDYDSAALRTESRQTLREMAEVFVAYPETRISVEGHTDSTGSDSYNMRLSDKRADAVRAFLVGQGVDGIRVGTAGYGESRPVADNSTAAGRQLNRRVEIHVTATGTGTAGGN